MRSGVGLFASSSGLAVLALAGGLGRRAAGRAGRGAGLLASLVGLTVGAESLLRHLQPAPHGGSIALPNPPATAGTGHLPPPGESPIYLRNSPMSSCKDTTS